LEIWGLNPNKEKKTDTTINIQNLPLKKLMLEIIKKKRTNNQLNYLMLDICMLASLLLKQIYKQDVGPNVSTCGYDFSALISCHN